jgi:hypothetical protein
LLLFVFGCEGTWLDCFLRVGDDMNPNPRPTDVGQLRPVFGKKLFRPFVHLFQQASIYRTFFQCSRKKQLRTPLVCSSTPLNIAVLCRNYENPHLGFSGRLFSLIENVHCMGKSLSCMFVPRYTFFCWICPYKCTFSIKKKGVH